MFGKGDPILLVSPAQGDMNTWDPSLLSDLSSNHTVIVFDNRGVGNTTTGNKPFSILQFANDTAGLLEMNDIHVSWKKISRGVPRGRQAANDRAPTREEIQRLLEYPDRRIKPIVYTMISSGIRIGA